MKTELKRFNLVVYKNVLATEQTLPIIAFVTFIFILNVLTDRNFIIAFLNLFFSKNQKIFGEIASTRDLVSAAKWSEYQVSVNFFAIYFFNFIDVKHAIGKYFYIRHINETNLDRK